MRMNHHHLRISAPLAALFFLVCVAGGPSGAAEVKVSGLETKSNLSLKMEVQHAIDKGLEWLKKSQHPEGYWSQKEHPALTALALTSFMGDPSGRYKAQKPAFIQKGYDYLLSCLKADGGIYVTSLGNYNTSVSIMALVVSGNAAYERVIRHARNYLVSMQGDFDQKGVEDNTYDGGIGYGGRYTHSDMSNTMMALEALYYTRHLKADADKIPVEFKELNWPAVIKFISRCQNLPEYNDQSWASDDPANKGGFVYFPGDSKAGEQELPSDRKALRSYGSISYAGLLSLIYADLDRNDPRIRAVFDWLRRNFTLEENPGMGPEGLFYYYHTMAKALSIYGADKIELADGRLVDWRKELTLRLLNLQNADGSWVNQNGRWWEKDPNLVTCYATIIMEILYQGL